MAMQIFDNGKKVQMDALQLRWELARKDTMVIIDLRKFPRFLWRSPFLVGVVIGFIVCTVEIFVIIWHIFK